jgi:hypothetical protein
MDKNARMRFMKYALPCVNVLVKRGTVTREQLNKLIEIVKNNKELPQNAERIPAVAFAVCSLIAIDNGKKTIDNEVIDEYFLFRHDDMIDKRYEEMGDFDTQKCRVRAGVVQSVTKNSATIKNSAGTKKYRTDFTTGLKKNDLVTTHWDFVVEKIDAARAEKIEKSEKKSVNEFKEGLRKQGILTKVAVK